MNESSKVFLSLGSNIGDREAHLREAITELSDALQIDAVSSIYETDPVGVTDQPRFLNLAVAGETVLPPVALLREIKRIEHGVGRRPTFRWGPREIDIDILAYGDRALETADLTIPHRELTRRAFALVPLAEIAPSFVHPTTGMTIAELRDCLDCTSSVHLLRPFEPTPRA